MNKNIEYIIVAYDDGSPSIGSIMRWDNFNHAFVVGKIGTLQKTYNGDPAKEPKFYEPYNIPKRMVLSEKI